MNRRLLILSALVITLLIPRLAHAAVVETSPSSLSIRQSATVAAPPEKVWQSFVHVELWWSSVHTYSGSAGNLHLDARPGGCFCESLPHDGGVQHMTVAFVSPNSRMVLNGALGPLQPSGVAGALTLEIKPKGSGSEVTLTYNVGGFFPGGLDKIAGGVDSVLQLQFGRLTRLIETGSADLKKAP